MPRHYQPPVKVMLDCSKEWVPEDRVEVQNIEEDPTGRDILTFRCPECNETHQSLRVVRGY